LMMLSDTLENKAKLTSICHYNTHTFKGIVHLKCMYMIAEGTQ